MVIFLTPKSLIVFQSDGSILLRMWMIHSEWTNHDIVGHNDLFRRNYGFCLFPPKFRKSFKYFRSTLVTPWMISPLSDSLIDLYIKIQKLVMANKKTFIREESIDIWILLNCQWALWSFYKPKKKTFYHMTNSCKSE